MDDLETLAELKIQLAKLNNKIARTDMPSKRDASKGRIKTAESSYQTLIIQKRELEHRIYKLEEKLGATNAKEYGE
jgi:hypothetical protein